MKRVHAQLLGTIFGLLVVILFLLMQGCVGLPTLEATPTAKPTQGNQLVTLPANTPTSVGSVTITGNVYIRDSVGNERGWLAAGSEVLAVCEGQWCVLADGGLRFWRGCASDNPEGLKCLPR